MQQGADTFMTSIENNLKKIRGKAKWIWKVLVGEFAESDCIVPLECFPALEPLPGQNLTVYNGTEMGSL